MRAYVAGSKLAAILALLCWHWPYGLYLHTRLVLAAVAAVVVR